MDRCIFPYIRDFLIPGQRIIGILSCGLCFLFIWLRDLCYHQLMHLSWCTTGSVTSMSKPHLWRFRLQLLCFCSSQTVYDILTMCFGSGNDCWHSVPLAESYSGTFHSAETYTPLHALECTVHKIICSSETRVHDSVIHWILSTPCLTPQRVHFLHLVVPRGSVTKHYEVTSCGWEQAVKLYKIMKLFPCNQCVLFHLPSMYFCTLFYQII